MSSGFGGDDSCSSVSSASGACLDLREVPLGLLGVALDVALVGPGGSAPGDLDRRRASSRTAGGALWAPCPPVARPVLFGVFPAGLRCRAARAWDGDSACGVGSLATAPVPCARRSGVRDRCRARGPGECRAPSWRAVVWTVPDAPGPSGGGCAGLWFPGGCCVSAGDASGGGIGGGVPLCCCAVRSSLVLAGGGRSVASSPSSGTLTLVASTAPSPLPPRWAGGVVRPRRHHAVVSFPSGCAACLVQLVVLVSGVGAVRSVLYSSGPVPLMPWLG